MDKRALQFQSFDELLADVDRLRGGYEQGGQWTLAEMLDHLTKARNAPLDGIGPRMFPPLTWLVRAMIRRMVRKQKYPTMQFKAPPFMRPTPGIALEEAYPAFRSSIERAGSINTPTIKTRTFGTLETEVLKGLDLLHSAHHLSFLHPKT